MKREIVCGDALEVLRGLPDESVHCCVTSPPYWGLRDYGVEGQLGLEETPEVYVERLVGIFRDVRRVLRDDGTVWLNLGDSYASGKGTCYNPGGGDSSLGKHRKESGAHPLDRGNKSTLAASGLKPKDLVGIPWRVAFALQADGWWLRSDIIWSKPNPMPESVQDRPTKAHEYIFLLSKSAKYYYDNEAIKEPVVCVGADDGTRVFGGKNKAGANSKHPQTTGRTYGKHSTQDAQSSGRRIVENVKRARAEGAEHDSPFGTKRNKRTVWTVSTKPFKEAHFAVFPPDLIRPCVLAGCPEGGTVLDPFFGAGTTGMVAKQEARGYIGIELNPEYAEMARERIKRECPMERLI